MPKLSDKQLDIRSTQLKNLYKKHKGNKSRIARELGISPQALHERFKCAPAKNVEEDYNAELQKAARKLGISINWYLEQLYEGATKSNKIVGYLQKHKKEGGAIERVEPDQSISNEFIEVPDRPTRHKYLVTIGEVMKYLRQAGGPDVRTQVFVGSQFSELVHTIQETQVRSDAELD